MKRLIVASLVFVLFSVLIASVHASVTIQAVLDQNMHVAFIFKNINSTIYANIKQRKPSLDGSTIPQIIVNTLKQKNLTNIEYYNSQLFFDDLDRSIHATFYMSGSDVLNFIVNKAMMVKVYYVKTDWRKFHVNLTDRFSLNFTEYFGTSMSKWERINYTDSENRVHQAYFYNSTGLNSFDPLCYFILPTTAMNVRVVEDMIIFEAPLSLEDTLLSSPFLILGALIAVVIAAFFYRRVR